MFKFRNQAYGQIFGDALREYNARNSASSTESAIRGELQSTQDSIDSFLRELEAKKRALEEKRHDNKKLKDQAIVEVDLVKSEETKRAGEKVLREADALKAIQEGREAELDEREAVIKRKEYDLETEIETEAEKRILLSVISLMRSTSARKNTSGICLI